MWGRSNLPRFFSPPASGFPRHRGTRLNNEKHTARHARTPGLSARRRIFVLFDVASREKKLIHRIAAALRGFAVALSFATTLAVFAPGAHAQAGSLTYNGAATCTSFSSFAWVGSQLTVNCAQSAPACDTTTPGTFSFVSSTATVARGGSTTLQIQRTGGCKGAYTVSFGNGIATGAPGSTLSPASSVSFANGDSATKTVTFRAGTTAGLAGVFLSGYSPITNPAPGLSGGVAVTVQ